MPTKSICGYARNNRDRGDYCNGEVITERVCVVIGRDEEELNKAGWDEIKIDACKKHMSSFPKTYEELIDLATDFSKGKGSTKHEIKCAVSCCDSDVRHIYPQRIGGVLANFGACREHKDMVKHRVELFSNMVDDFISMITEEHPSKFKGCKRREE